PVYPYVEDLTAPSPLEVLDHDEWPTDERLYLHPLIRLSSGDIVIAVPGSLAGSIVHRALIGAVEIGAASEAVMALHVNTMRTAARYLRRIRWSRVRSPESLPPVAGFAESFWRFDVDKVAHVI